MGKYFTSRIKNNPDKRKRPNLYLDALQTLDPAPLKIYYGDDQSEEVKCRSCQALIPEDREKQTDVKTATHMLLNAFSNNKVDDLILITADSDQCPAVKAAQVLGKHVLVVLPP